MGSPRFSFLGAFPFFLGGLHAGWWVFVSSESQLTAFAESSGGYLTDPLRGAKSGSLEDEGLPDQGWWERCGCAGWNFPGS